MKKGDLLRRVTVLGSPIEGLSEYPAGPYVLVSGPKEGSTKVSDHLTRIMTVVDVYFEGRMYHSQPVNDFIKYE